MTGKNVCCARDDYRSDSWYDTTDLRTGVRGGYPSATSSRIPDALRNAGYPPTRVCGREAAGGWIDWSPRLLALLPMDIRRGARALLLDRDDRILLIHRVKDGVEYFPTVGGGIDPEDRTPEDAMRREAFEEMGALVGPAQLIYLSTTPHRDWLAVQYIFLARLLRMDYHVRSDPPVKAGERHDPYWTSWGQLPDLDLRPQELREYLITNSLVLQEIAHTL